MVGNVFRKHNERYGRIRHRDGYKVGSERTAFAEIVVAFERFHKREVGVPLHIFKLREIDYFQRVDFRRIADRREDRRYRIAGKNTDDKRNQFRHFLAVNRAGDYREQRNKSARQSNVRIANRAA